MLGDISFTLTALKRWRRTGYQPTAMGAKDEEDIVKSLQKSSCKHEAAEETFNQEKLAYL